MAFYLAAVDPVLESFQVHDEYFWSDHHVELLAYIGSLLTVLAIVVFRCYPFRLKKLLQTIIHRFLREDWQTDILERVKCIGIISTVLAVDSRHHQPSEHLVDYTGVPLSI